jgi:DNA primase
MREHVLALLQRHLPGSVRPGAGGNVLTKCPFHKGGQELKPSFSVNVDLGVFHCFTCHVAGDVRYMLRLLGLPRSQIDNELQTIQKELDSNRENQQLAKKFFFSNEDPFKTKTVLPEVLLGAYEWCPNLLVEQGFDPKLLQDMEIGFDRNLQRVTYPLRDLYGNLAGIAGGRTLPTQEPKYLVYQGGRRNARHEWIVGEYGPNFDELFPGFTCENHDFIWNYHRVYPRALMAASEWDSSVVLVEGYKANMWMVQAGYYNTVALMGSYISETQQRLLHRLGGTVYLFFDNDKAGREATTRIGRLLWRPLHGRLKVIPYPPGDVEASLAGEDDSQPDDYEPAGIHEMVQSSIDFSVYLSLSRRSMSWQ